MKLYYIMGTFLGTQAEARAAAREHDVKFVPEQDTVEVPTDKEGLIDYLNRLIVAQRGQQSMEDHYTSVVERQDPPVEVMSGQVPLYRDSVALDHAFELAPLGQQLTLATIALENARNQIGRENAPAKAAQGYRGKAEAPAADDELFS